MCLMAGSVRFEPVTQKRSFHGIVIPLLRRSPSFYLAT